MRIAVDARELVGAVTGTGRYLGQILTEWNTLAAAARHEFVLYSPRDLPVLDTLAPRLAATRRVLPGSGGTRWEQVTLSAALRRDRPDVLFAPAYTAPLLTAVPTALTVHDVSFAAHPEWFRPREGARRRFVTGRAARAARVVLTVSAFSKAEIVRLLEVPADRVRIVPHGLGVSPSAATRSPAPARKPLVLFVGSIFNRRHVPDLVRAMPGVVARHPDARLSIVGDDRSWPPEDLHAIAGAAGVADRVAIESFVSDDELRARYLEAAAFAFLSEYEGFGLTPLEALAAGVPIVVLDTPVAREVYGAAARYVPSTDPQVVADALNEIMEEGPARRAVLEAASFIRARYRWTEAAAATLAAIESAAVS